MRAKVATLFVFVQAVTGVACVSSGVAGPHSRYAPHEVNAKGLGKHHALIVSVGDYGARFGGFSLAKDDATDLKRVLQEEYAYEVEPLLPDPTDLQIKAALGSLRHRLSIDDSLLIYFSGHGEDAWESDGGWWLPANAEPLRADQRTAAGTAEANAHWISRRYVIEQIRDIEATAVLVVDDSCYPRAVSTADDSAFLRYSKHHDGADVSPEKLRRRVRRWLSAGGRESVAARSLDGKHSFFAGYFLDVLQGNAGVMSGTAVFEAIQRRMSSDPELQVPNYDPIIAARDDGGDYLWIKKTFSQKQIELGIGTVVVQTVGKDGDTTRELLQKLTIDALREVDARQKPRDSPRPLMLAISTPKTKELSLTLIDRRTDQILGSAGQFLSKDPEEMSSNVGAAVLNVVNAAEYALDTKEISADVVERALVAQRHHDWEFTAATGITAYVDFDGDGLLRNPASSTRITVDKHVMPWLMLGADLGFHTTKAESNHLSYLGDLDDGTYSKNRLRGELSMHTEVAMATATVRSPHGLVLPFWSIGVGVAHHDLKLGDERFVPESKSDTLPINLINRRDDTAGFALAMDVSAGLNLVLSEYASLIGRAELFKHFHDLKIRSRLDGVAQVKSSVKDFQAIQGLTMQVGAAFMF